MVMVQKKSNNNYNGNNNNSGYVSKIRRLESHENGQKNLQIEVK